VKAALRYLPIALAAIAWEAVVRLGWISPEVLPPPTRVLAAGWELMRAGDLWGNTAASLWRTGAGLALAVVVGGVLGLLMAWWRPVDAFVGPLVEMLYPMPKSALIPITVLWLGFGDGSKILLIFLGCMLPVTLGAYNGARSTEQTLVWSARSAGASRLGVLWDVVLPSALPELANGVRTALALSFVLLVSSELIVSRSGLGHLIGFLGEGGVYDAMFAVVLIVAFLGFFADRVYQLALKRAFAWRG
jgi:ABC-type nitrate/sulfonate/bicarbonate transport system permease component